MDGRKDRGAEIGGEVMNPSVVSFGGGVNSTAMLLGMYERQMRPDLILFADTGGEKPETYRHRDEFSAWLIQHRMPEIVTVREERRTLEEECLDNHTLPSIVIGMRSCSDKYKIRPQNRYLSQWEPAVKAWENGEAVTKYIGFDAGEPWRVKASPSEKYLNRFLLIEWEWDRDDCLAAFARHNLTPPPKSSCFFCPEMQEREIIDLAQDHPDLAARAIAMEHNNSSLYGVRGLKRNHTFEEIIDYHERQGCLLNVLQPPRIPCMCYDGEALRLGEK